MEEPRLVANGVHCKMCDTLLFSYTTHDFKVCSCDNKTMVDGGLSYPKYGGNDMSFVSPITIYSNDPFEKVRNYHCRGARGKSGKEPLKWIPLCKMTDEHLAAVIEYGGAPWHLELISKELQYRREHPEASIPEVDTITVIDRDTKLRTGSIISVSKTVHHMKENEPYLVTLIHDDALGFSITNKHGNTSLCLKEHCSYLEGTGAKYLLLKY